MSKGTLQNCKVIFWHPHIWGYCCCFPPWVKIDEMKPRKIRKSIKKINHPNSLIALFRIPNKSTNIRIPKVVILPRYTICRTSGALVFLADHVQIPKPNAQAPEIRVFKIPTRFVVLPKRERLYSGKNKNETAFRRVRNAEIVVIVLNFIVLTKNLIWND